MHRSERVTVDERGSGRRLGTLARPVGTPKRSERDGSGPTGKNPPETAHVDRAARRLPTGRWSCDRRRVPQVGGGGASSCPNNEGPDAARGGGRVAGTVQVLRRRRLRAG